MHCGSPAAEKFIVPEFYKSVVNPGSIISLATEAHSCTLTLPGNSAVSADSRNQRPHTECVDHHGPRNDQGLEPTNLKQLAENSFRRNTEGASNAVYLRVLNYFILNLSVAHPEETFCS